MDSMRALLVAVLITAFALVAFAGCTKKKPVYKPVPTDVDVPDKVPKTGTWWTPKDKPCPRFKTYFKCRRATQADCVERRGTRNFCKS